MRKKRLLSTIVVGLMIILAAVSAHAEDFGVVMGFGAVIHNFVESDDLRRKPGKFPGEVDIKLVFGNEVYGEYFIWDNFAFGIKGQHMEGGVNYDREYDTLKLRIKLKNYIGYGNFLAKVGSGYWRLGITGGYGRSRYTYTEERECKTNAISCSNTYEEDSSTGSIVLLGFIVDWGRKALGGRLGVHSVAANHPAIEVADGEKLEVKASGSQLFVDFRYAF